ncbi:tRNA (adenosine(37)-N6)-threonylcarbamoyltransferase complex dimerization subunit type 1 TsaB, partial [Mycoplasmopsis pullorum]
KVHLIVSEFQKMIEKNQVPFEQILGLMTNLGPGYFTGVRSSLVFFRTLAMTWNVPIFTINSFEILVQQKPLQKQYYLDAQGSKLFYYENMFDVVD